MEEKLLNQVAMKIETCIDMQNGATKEQLQDILLDVNTLKSYMGFEVNGVDASQRQALHKHNVTNRRELLLLYEDWINDYPTKKEREQQVDKFLKSNSW